MFNTVLQLLSCLHFLLYFIFKLGHIQHKVIYFLSQYCNFFSFKIFSKSALLLCDSFFSPLMRYFLPAFEKSQQFLSVQSISIIILNSFFFLSSFSIYQKMFPAYSIVKFLNSHIEKSLHAAHILIF